MGISRRIAESGLAALLVSAAVGCSGVSSPPASPSGPSVTVGLSGDSLHKLANNPALWVGPDSANRPCIGGRCDWPIFTKRTKVVIWAEDQARNVGPNPTPTGGTLIGKFENRGGGKEAQYGLQPGPYDFLMFAYPGTGAHGRWAVVQIDRRSGHQVRIASEGVYRGCDHPYPWQVSFAHFRTCEDGLPPPRPTASRGRAAAGGVNTAGLNLFSFLALLQTGVDDDPAWYTCTSGCCVADGARLF